MALHIGRYEDVLRTLHWYLLRTSYLNLGRGRPQDVSEGRPLALHRGPYGDVHGSSFADVLRMSSGRNFAMWKGSVLGPLLFFIYINGIHFATKASCPLHFVNNTCWLNIQSSIKQINRTLKTKT